MIINMENIMIYPSSGLWNQLAHTKTPVALYGMGNGADKVLDHCLSLGIPVVGVFANDGFVRGQHFRGFTVQTLSALEAAENSFTVLLCFATERPEVLEQIQAVAARHPLLVPDFPVIGDEPFTPEYVQAHQREFDWALYWLEDARSREIMLDLIDGKCTGDLHLLRRSETSLDEAFSLLQLGGEEIYVDAGAYNGDTVEDFLRRTGGRFRRILALEPDSRNFRKLIATAERLGIGIDCRNVGVWREKATLSFDHASGRQAALRTDKKGKPTEVDSIDALLDGAPATFIKYDVEGAEYEALLGTAQTIRTYKPKLAVSAYHRREDLFALPALIHELNPDYRIYLRHHPYLPAWETNFYCI